MPKTLVNTIQRTVLGFLGAIFLLGLIGISVPNPVVSSLDPDETETAKRQIRALEKALERFLYDHGRYPTTHEGLGALVRDPGSLNWAGPYLPTPGITGDPWGRPYMYISPGDHGSYDVWSFGADGLPGGARRDVDLLSWGD